MTIGVSGFRLLLVVLVVFFLLMMVVGIGPGRQDWDSFVVLAGRGVRDGDRREGKADTDLGA
jgi:hypothetical protein